MTGGMLWFTDLASPDPTGILPVLAGTINLLNVMTTQVNSDSTFFRKMRQFMFIMPLVTVPVWMTFPAAFNIYWITTSSIQFLFINVIRSQAIRKRLGIP